MRIEEQIKAKKSIRKAQVIIFTIGGIILAKILKETKNV